MTFYSEIFEIFLLKIADCDLLGNLTDEEIRVLCTKYLKIAVSKFRHCKKNLSKRNDEEQMFECTLSDLEMNIVASLMVIEWLNPYVTNRLNLSSFLADKDYKTYSQANHLKVLIELKEKLTKEVEQDIIDYTWDNFDIKNLGDALSDDNDYY